MSEEADQLVTDNTREELDALAASEGISDPETYDTKEDLAEAIVAYRGGATSLGDPDAADTGEPVPEASDVQQAAAPSVDGALNQHLYPGGPSESDAVADSTDEEEEFERVFGHLEGEQLDTARQVWEKQKEQQATFNERASGHYPSTAVKE